MEAPGRAEASLSFGRKDGPQRSGPSQSGGFQGPGTRDLRGRAEEARPGNSKGQRFKRANCLLETLLLVERPAQAATTNNPTPVHLSSGLL